MKNQAPFDNDGYVFIVKKCKSRKPDKIWWYGTFWILQMISDSKDFWLCSSEEKPKKNKLQIYNAPFKQTILGLAIRWRRRRSNYPKKTGTNHIDPSIAPDSWIFVVFRLCLV